MLLFVTSNRCFATAPRCAITNTVDPVCLSSAEDFFSNPDAIGRVGEALYESQNLEPSRMSSRRFGFSRPLKRSPLTTEPDMQGHATVSFTADATTEPFIAWIPRHENAPVWAGHQRGGSPDRRRQKPGRTPTDAQSPARQGALRWHGRRNAQTHVAACARGPHRKQARRK